MLFLNIHKLFSKSNCSRQLFESSSSSAGESTRACLELVAPPDGAAAEEVVLRKLLPPGQQQQQQQQQEADHGQAETFDGQRLDSRTGNLLRAQIRQSKIYFFASVFLRNT
jgi:hypothetical protein